MTNTPFPEAGQSAPLEHTKAMHERIIVGLSWDARGEKVGAISHLISKDSQHDLDINCFVYDQNRTCIDFIGAEANETVDKSGKIYHSGDNMCGAGEGDDETITVELANIPGHYNTLVFLVEVSGIHVFSEIENPAIRIVDSMSNAELLQTDLTHEQGANSKAFAFAAIYRDSTSPSGWTLTNISEYPDISQITDWADYLGQYA